MTTVPGWRSVVTRLLLIALVSENSAFAPTCSCQTQHWGNYCVTCYTGCFLYYGRCYRCPASCVSCTDQYNCDYCTEGYFGRSCENTCLNCKDNTCHKNNGDCTIGCKDGYYYNTGLAGCSKCSTQCRTCNSLTDCTACKEGFISNGNCLQCTDVCVNGTCNKEDGSCTDGCIDGLTTRYCNDQCHPNCVACEQYNKETCTSCKPGYHGRKCDVPCEAGCQDACDRDKGTCDRCGVQSGHESATESNNNGAIIGAATGSAIVVLIVVILLTVFFIMRRKRRNTSNAEQTNVALENNPDNVYSMLDRADQDHIADYTSLNALAGQLQEGQANPSPPIDTQTATYVNTDDISTGPSKDSYENVIGLRE